MQGKFFWSCILIVLLTYWALAMYAIQATHQATPFWLTPIWGTHILWFTLQGGTDILLLPPIWGMHIPVIFAIIPVVFFLVVEWMRDGKFLLSCILVALVAFWFFSMYAIQATHQATPFWPSTFVNIHAPLMYIILAASSLLICLLLVDVFGDKLVKARWNRIRQERKEQERPRTRRKIIEGANDPHYIDEQQIEAEYNSDLPDMVTRSRVEERSFGANAGADFKILTATSNLQNKTTESAEAREVRLQEMLIRHVNFALDKNRVICVLEKSLADDLMSLPSLAPYYAALGKGDYSALLTALSKGDYSAFAALGKSDYSAFFTALSKGDYSTLAALGKGDYSVIKKMLQDPIQKYIKEKCDALDQIKENTPILIAGSFSVHRSGDRYIYQMEHPVNNYLLDGQKYYIFTAFVPCDEITKRYKYLYEEPYKKGLDEAEILVTLYGTALPIVDQDEHIKRIRVTPTAIW